MKNCTYPLPVIFLICLMALFSCGIPCIPSNLHSDVIAFYPFTNATLNDQSGHNHNLINNNGAVPATDRSGTTDCAYQFNNWPVNNNQYLTIQNPGFLNNLTDFSISLWYLPENNTRPIGLYETLVGRDNVGACPDRSGQWSVGLYDCRKAVYGRLNSVWDQNIITSNFNCQMEVDARTNGLWHHLTATYNNSGGVMKIYRDGILQQTATGPGNCGVATTIQDVGDLFIGMKYTGKIDDLILFKKTLTQADVDDLFQMSSCCGMYN
jgi:hypothetical protein